MPFACGRTCVVVAVVILVGFVVAALACGRREAFDAGASDAVDKLHTVTESNRIYKTYAHLDTNDKGVCYPNEVLKRHNATDPPCTSFRVQNPAVYHDNIYMATTQNPLKRVVFVNEPSGPEGHPKTLKDVLLDPEVQHSINEVFGRQKTMSENIQTYYQRMKEVKAEVKRQQNALPTQSKGTPASPSVNLIPPPTPDISTPPKKTCASASDKATCQYKEYKYTNPLTITYPGSLPSIADVEVATPPDDAFAC